MNQKFNFITNRMNSDISKNYIRNLEKKLNVSFPACLKEYYLKYNGSDMKECCFEMRGIEYDVLSICNLGNSNHSVERILERNVKNIWVPREFYPIALDDINVYYWNTKNNIVYYLMIDDDENPIAICNGVEAFFDILNENCNNKITIPSFDVPKWQDNMNGKRLHIYDPEKILIFDKKQILYFFIILLVCASPLIFEGIMESWEDIFHDIRTILLVLFIPCLFLMNIIINYIKSRHNLNKYNISEVKRELTNCKKLNHSNIYFTNNYIVSTEKIITINRYNEIKWIYHETGGRRHFYSAAISFSNSLNTITLLPVVAYLKTGKKVLIGMINKKDILDYEKEIKNKSNEIMVGYSYINMYNKE